MPFVVISALFWLLHTWILDPVPNQFRRREFIRYRREILHVGTKLNFRSPARQVFIDTSGPEFIGWDDINGIDEVRGRTGWWCQLTCGARGGCRSSWVFFWGIWWCQG
jgi:cell division protease FtsH